MQQISNSGLQNGLPVFADNGKETFAEIVIPLALPKNYTWSVPAHMQPVMQPGIRVEVNLGKKKRKLSPQKQSLHICNILFE